MVSLPHIGTFCVYSPFTNGHCGEWRSCSDLKSKQTKLLDRSNTQ